MQQHANLEIEMTCHLDCQYHRDWYSLSIVWGGGSSRLTVWQPLQRMTWTSRRKTLGRRILPITFWVKFEDKISILYGKGRERAVTISKKSKPPPHFHIAHDISIEMFRIELYSTIRIVFLITLNPLLAPNSNVSVKPFTHSPTTHVLGRPITRPSANCTGRVRVLAWSGWTAWNVKSLQF